MTNQTNGDDCRESGAGETSREQFEAWTKMFGGKPDLTRANGGANYADSFIDIAWLAWKASRAAIEIHLPGEFRESYQSSNMVMDAEAVKEKLADAGINFTE